MIERKLWHRGDKRAGSGPLLWFIRIREITLFAGRKAGTQGSEKYASHYDRLAETNPGSLLGVVELTTSIRAGQDSTAECLSAPPSTSLPPT